MFIPFWSAFRLRNAMRNRVPISDNDFAGQIRSASDHRALIIAVRRAFARCCKVPPEAIYPDDIVYDLADILFPFVGWDETEFLNQLEEELRFTIKYGAIVFPYAARYSVSAWIPLVVRQVQEVVRSQAI